MNRDTKCLMCPELTKCLANLERRLTDECRWNLVQEQYRIQLQEQMQKDEDQWKMEEGKLQQHLKDLNHKIEILYKNIQMHNKERVQLELQNEVLEDQKQELQDKVVTLQSKLKNLCANMCQVQYKARMLEEKLSKMRKLLEEHQKLQEKTFKLECQKERLETKVNKLQEEKKELQEELEQLRKNNCQIEMEVIELNEKLTDLKTRMLPVQKSQKLKGKSENFLDCNLSWKECGNFMENENDCTKLNKHKAPNRKICHKETDSSIINVQTLQNCFTAKKRQQANVHKNNAVAIQIAPEMSTLAEKYAIDNLKKCSFVTDHIKNEDLSDHGKANEMTRSCSLTIINQKCIHLDEGENVHDNFKLNHPETLAGRVASQINVCKEEFENTQESPVPLLTVISENFKKDNTNKDAHLQLQFMKHNEKISMKISDSFETVSDKNIKLMEEEETINANKIKDIATCTRASCMNLYKDEFQNTFFIKDKICKMKDYFIDNFDSTEILQDIKIGICAENCYQENKTDTNIAIQQKYLHSGKHYAPSKLCMKHKESSEELTSTEETKSKQMKYAPNFIQSKTNTTQLAASIHTSLNGLVSAETVRTPEIIFGYTNIKECKTRDNGLMQRKNTLCGKGVQTENESILNENSILKCEFCKECHLKSDKILETELQKVHRTNKYEGIFNTLTMKNSFMTEKNCTYENDICSNKEKKVFVEGDKKYMKMELPAEVWALILEYDVTHEAKKASNDNLLSNKICKKCTLTTCRDDRPDCTIKEVNSRTNIISMRCSSQEMNLVTAAREGKLSDMEELLSLGICPNSLYNGDTALHSAAETGNLQICRLLLEAGARVDARNSSSGTPLHAAARGGQLEVGKLLTTWGASTEDRDMDGNFAYDIAIQHGNFHMSSWLQIQRTMMI